MKNLSRLPLEIWLMILKIRRWTDRKNILTNFHKTPKNIILNTEKLDFFEEEDNDYYYHDFTNLLDFDGWCETYVINGKTHNFCTISYPDFYNTNLFIGAILENENSYDNWNCENGRFRMWNGQPIYYYFNIIIKRI